MRSVVAYLDEGGPLPAELGQALRMERWGKLYYPGALSEQPEMFMRRTEAAHDMWRAWSMYRSPNMSANQMGERYPGLLSLAFRMDPKMQKVLTRVRS